MNTKLTKLLTIYFLLLIFTLLISCINPVEPPVESPIDCDGHYRVYYQDWQHCGCPSCETYDRGTYWINRIDGRMFLIGEAVINPIEVFGKCPVVYIEEIKLEG